MTTDPTGRIVHLGGRLTLQLTRTFHAPVEDVWAALTEPERMERWIGTWTGDPATGRVVFRMTAEGEGAAAEEVEIRACEPPHRLAVTSRFGQAVWHLDVDLSEAGGVTTLAFSQPDLDPEDAPSIGPGWEYYLDRLGAVLTGGDVAAYDFERDYYPAMAEHYTPPVTGTA